MSITLLSGDCRDVLPTLAANSVHTCVTSPPYYALRDYGCAGQIGLEATPDEYLATMVAVMREVRRVLRPDGTCWINIGDSYASGVGMARDQPYQRHAPQKSGLWKGTRSEKRDIGNNGVVKDGAGLKPKDLMLMPARLALALQADGWWVRSDIIWHKPNPMPESVTDRPTSAHEHVFLLTKSARYFYDADAVREESEPSSLARAGIVRKPSPKELASVETGNWSSAPGQSGAEYGVGRNLRNVWTIATHAYPQAHFATYPPELAERCIRAGTSERGCCAACGAPWRREVEHGAAVPLTPSDAGRKATWTIGDASRDPASRVDTPLPRHYRPATTTGWSASCACAADVVPATVLDPFAGAGTTLLVADRLQRNAVGIELNAAYTTMAMERCRADAPLFADTPEPQPVLGFAQPDLFAEAAD